MIHLTFSVFAEMYLGMYNCIGAAGESLQWKPCPSHICSLSLRFLPFRVELHLFDSNLSITQRYSQRHHYLHSDQTADIKALGLNVFLLERFRSYLVNYG